MAHIDVFLLNNTNQYTLQRQIKDKPNYKHRVLIDFDDHNLRGSHGCILVS